MAAAVISLWRWQWHGFTFYLHKILYFTQWHEEGLTNQITEAGIMPVWCHKTVLLKQWASLVLIRKFIWSPSTRHPINYFIKITVMCHTGKGFWDMNQSCPISQRTDIVCRNCPSISILLPRFCGLATLSPQGPELRMSKARSQLLSPRPPPLKQRKGKAREN